VIIEQRRLKPDVVRPTLSRVNRFTEGFQAIVDGYGIPDYKEINPTFFAIAMFPFLFGVMFGDMIHGLLMTIFAALLIWQEEKFLKMEERNEIFEYMFSGRYTLLMMGICATYMGLIYNEALSCSIDFFGSAYTYSYLCTTSWKGGGSSAFGGQPFPEFGGLRGAAVDGEVQFLPQGCTAATMKAVPTTENCWSYMEPVFDKLPCGTNEKYRCGEEVKQALTCGGQYNLADIPETVTVSKEAFVVPSDHGDDGFLPSDVGQPGTGTADGGHMNPHAAVPAKAKYSPYLFGVDPVWRYSTQNIQFTNSLKMKMSVILGVSQMMVGIILKWFNTIHFKKWGYLGSVCIPELLFMSCTFVYMCMLIFIKWSTDYAQGQIGEGVPCWESCPTLGTAAEYNNQGCFREPPMVITTLIGMFMSTGTVGQDQTDKWDRCKFFLFESQESVQVVCLVIALICVPWLFAVEPILVHRAHKAEVLKKERAGMVAHTSEESAEEDEDDPSEAPGADDEFSMGDVIVGQAIHAIEFILGAVSNTASYLRLWALSLAHSQLSEVFWEYIFKGYEIELLGGQYPGLASNNVFFILACYLVFFACTIAVLMVMESLSAFLHALRLQWVEFQNKFYHATGQKFHPLDFEDPDMPFDMDN
jgi:vacuolar-type H+-ATPase subunit I/STV1